MKNRPPVIPFLFFIAVIITLASIAVYAGNMHYPIVAANKNLNKQEVIIGSNESPELEESGQMDPAEARLNQDETAQQMYEAISTTNELVKFIKAPDQSYWFQIDSRHKDTANTTIWRVSRDEYNNHVGKEIFSARIGGCTEEEVKWDITEEEQKGNILLDYDYARFCHGGVVREINEYTAKGENLLKITSNDYNEVSVNGIDIRLDISDKCPETYSEEEMIPTVKVLGLKIGKEKIKFDKQPTVQCSGELGGGLWWLPGFYNLSYQEGILTLKLPDGKQSALIDTEMLIKNKGEKAKEAISIK